MNAVLIPDSIYPVRLQQSGAYTVKSLEDFLSAERSERSPCRVTITLTAAGPYRARMTFAPGMESAIGEGATVADALERLENALNYGSAA